MQRRKEMLAGSRTVEVNAESFSPTNCAKNESSLERKSKNVKHDGSVNSATGSPKKSILHSKNGSAQSGNGIRRNVTHEVPKHQNGKEEYNVKVKETMALSAYNSNSFDDDDKPQFQCPFCDWEYNGVQDELDKHFWKACPILTKCPQCRQVLEVAALNAHLTSECRKGFLIFNH